MEISFVGLPLIALGGCLICLLIKKEKKVRETHGSDSVTQRMPLQENRKMDMETFVFSSMPGVQMTPAEYGQAGIKWACEHSSANLAMILNLQHSSLLMEKMREAPFQAQLQLMALDSATYWAYALLVLKVPSNISTEVKRGLEVGLRGLRDPQGKKFNSAQNEVFKISFDAYLKAQRTEFEQAITADAAVYRPDGGLSSQVFFHILRQTYFLEVQQIDPVTKFLVGNIVDELVTIKLTTLRDELGLSFKF